MDGPTARGSMRLDQLAAAAHCVPRDFAALRRREARSVLLFTACNSIHAEPFQRQSPRSPSKTPGATTLARTTFIGRGRPPH